MEFWEVSEANQLAISVTTVFKLLLCSFLPFLLFLKNEESGMLLSLSLPYLNAKQHLKDIGRSHIGPSGKEVGLDPDGPPRKLGVTPSLVQGNMS